MKIMRLLFVLALCASPAGRLLAQGGFSPVPAGGGGGNAAPPATTVVSPANKPKDTTSFFGQEIPVFDPGSEVVSWGGQRWNITNQRVFQARIEKYLNAPAENGAEDKAYQAIIHQILDLLSPEKATNQTVYQAYILLFRASAFDLDANLCRTIAGAVATAWQAQLNQNQLAITSKELQDAMKAEQAKAILWQVNQEHSFTTQSNTGKKGASTSSAGGGSANTMRQGFSLKEAAQLQAQIAALTAKREVSALQARIQFQALMLQLFFQRRFQHVLIACDLYRQVFREGDAALKLDGQAKAFFTKDVGVPPTVSTLESMATEMMRDVREGVQAYLFLVDKKEMDSASKRLSESFLVGEYMPEIRTLDREKKRLALEYMQKVNRLISTLDVKDYIQAETLVKEIEAMAKDFDSTKPRAAIDLAKTESGFHLAKARTAGIAGDKQTFEDELKQAATVWPRNPALLEFATTAFGQSDVQAKALADFDQLLSQGNIRQIYNDKLRFIVAVSTSPERQAKLKKVLDDMQTIETAIARAEELKRRGDSIGAWEAVERASQQFPDDIELNRLRGSLSSEAARFVQCLKTAQQLEAQGQTGASLAWYLKAQRLSPFSDFAREGVERLSKKIMPESGT
jgi:hypothetical protein